MTPRRPAPVASHPGVRHAVLLTLCVVVPVTYGATAVTGARMEGFPVWGVVLLMAVAAVGSGLLGVDAKAPGLTSKASRMVGAAVLALGVRMTVPSPAGALAELRAGEAHLVSGAALVVFALLLVSAATGHLITTRVVVIAQGQPTTAAARADDQQLLIGAWATGLAMLVVAGMTYRAGGAVGQVLLAGAVLIALVTIAELRGRIPPPGATRAPIVAAPRAVGLAGIGVTLLAAVVVPAVVVPTLPDVLSEGLGRPSEWLAQTDLDWEPERGPGYAPEGDRAQTHGRDAVEPRRIPWLPDPRQMVVPLWVQVLVLGAGVLLLVFILRPERWMATLRRLWAVLRGGSWHEAGAVFDELAPLEEVDREGDGPRGRFRDALERVRPRPRDPRQAIVHDYLRAQRALARLELGRRPTETPLEHARRLRAHEPLADLAPLTELAGLVSAARYGRASPAQDAADRSRALQQQLEQGLRDRR
jgi:hypothetical protein